MRDKIIEILRGNEHAAENDFAVYNEDYGTVADQIINMQKKQNKIDSVKSGIVNLCVYGFHNKEELDIALELNLIEETIYNEHLLRIKH